MNLAELLSNFTIEYEGKKIDLNKIEIYKKPFEQNSIICKYAVRYWDDRENQWMYLEQSKCGYKIGMFNFNKDKAERFTLADANKEKVRIQCYDKKFGERLQVVGVTYNENDCLDCPPIGEDTESEIKLTERKYAIRYWDDKDGKWKYYRFGGGFGDKEDCQEYTYIDAKKVLAFSTTKKKLQIIDVTKTENNFVLGYINIFGKINYIKSLLKMSCWTTDKIEEAKHFTKIGAIQALEKILQTNMINCKNIEIEPFIVNLDKKEKQNV